MRIITQNQISKNSKQIKCRKCLQYHDLFYNQGKGILQLAYYHPIINRKGKSSGQFIAAPFIPNLPIPIVKSKELLKAEKAEAQITFI